MDEHREAATTLYAAFAAKDPQAILGALSDDFTGEVSAGMPLGVGGRHEGPEAMLRDVWGKVFAAYAVEVEADELLLSDDGRVTVLGGYRGTERSSGRAVDAAFAHVLTIRDGRVAKLVQITDTACWTPQDT